MQRFVIFYLITEGVENEESLKSSAIVGQLANTVKYKVDNFLSNGVVTMGVVIGGIFLSSNKLFWVEEGSVCSSSYFINDGWFQINEDGTWDVFASSSFREESVERVVTSSKGFITWHLTIRLDSMFQTVKLPASIAHLATGLANVDGDAFPL